MLSGETREVALTGDLQQIEHLAIDLRDAINEREDSLEVINFLEEIGIQISLEFCNRDKT
jgi:hypothetical protein